MKKSLVLLLGLLVGFEGIGYATPIQSLIAPLPLIAYPVRTTLMTIENDVPNGTVTIPLAPPTADAMLGWDYTTDPVHPVPIYYTLGTGFTRTAATNNAGGTINVSAAAGPAGPTGATGLSAYQVWLANGNTGTQTQFLTSLVSTVPGPAGTNGTNGAPYTPAGTITQYIRGDGSFATFPTFATVALSGSYLDLTNKPTIPAAQVQSDWNASSGLGVILNKPTIPTVTPFNFGMPNVRSLSLSTAYQATDATKAAIVTVSPSCVNSVTLGAASACTLSARVGTSTLTCSTGTPVPGWNTSYAAGLVLANTSAYPADIKLPIGAYFILCATSGTFTISAVDQSAG